LIIPLPKRRRCAAYPALCCAAVFLGVISGLIGPPKPALANSFSTLPPLGNTEQTDFALAREVDDDHVYSGDGQVQMPKSMLHAVQERNSRYSNGAPIERTGNVIWDAIRQSDQLPLNETELVAHYRRQYLDQAHYTNKTLARSAPYLAHFVKALDARFLPVELSLLPAVESGYHTNTVSKNNAAGIWQIVPITAREIGLQQTRWLDERADIIASTTAAIDYLSYLHAEFNGDWELTLAAYNAGPGRVRRAVKRNLEAGKPTHFTALELPEETRNYVPKLVALLQVVKGAGSNDIVLPDIPTEDAFKVLELNARISINQLAEVSGVSETTLKKLNSGLIQGVTPPDGPHRVYVPTADVQQVKRAVAKADPAGLFSMPRSHTVVAGDTLGGIALRYGMSMQKLQTINGIDSDRIRIGQTLSVLDSRYIEGPEIVEYVVSAGDTLSGIAAQFSVDMSKIGSASGQTISSDVIRPGDTLHIRVPRSSGS